MNEITKLNQIQILTRNGYSDWKSLGDVYAVGQGGLILLNYTAKAQYEGRWNFLETVSRGLILDAVTGEIVARPFDKFFNWGEGNRTTDAAVVSVTEKVDGSLGILYRQDGKYKVATRGAFTSEQAEWATKFLIDHHDLSSAEGSWTMLFEIVYPGNRIVLNYAGREELVLLAIRDRHTGEYARQDVVRRVAAYYDFPTPEVWTCTDAPSILEARSKLDAKREGCVAEFADGQRFKFKGDEYLRLHRLVCGLSFKNTLAAVAAGTDQEIRGAIPEEFAEDFDRWRQQIADYKTEVEKTVWDVFLSTPLNGGRGNRKDFAQWVLAGPKPLAPYLFALYDGKPIDQVIYKKAFEDWREEKVVAEEPE